MISIPLNIPWIRGEDGSPYGVFTTSLLVISRDSILVKPEPPIIASFVIFFRFCLLVKLQP